MAQDAHTFMEYCITGNIDDIKRMSLKNCDLNVGFRYACKNGYYMIVKYLVELYKTEPYDMIDIHSSDEWGFRCACYNGHYMIVKYLVELYKTEPYDMIDIHFYDEWGFRTAHYTRNYMIVKYLMILYKKHKYIYKPINNYLIIFDKFHKYKL